MYPQMLPGPALPEVSDAMARLYLARLRRLVALEAVADAEVDTARLLRQAIYSTYLDCRALGVKPEAQAILREAGRLSG